MPDTIKVALKLKVGTSSKIVSDGIGYQTEGAVPSPKPDIKPPVPGCELRYIGMCMKRIPVAFTLKAGKLHIDRLWADLNGNNQFDPSEEAYNAGPLASHPNLDSIQFKTTPRVRGRDLKIMMVAEGRRGLGFLQNSYLFGKTTLAGKEIRFKLRDSDYDGLYGMSTGRVPDTIQYWIDKKPYQTDPVSFLALGYGLYYKPFASEDGKTLTLIKYTGRLGRIEASRGTIERLGMFSLYNQFDAIAKSRSVSVPEGEYSLVEATLQLKGEDGRYYDVTYRKDRKATIHVANSKAVFLELDEKPNPQIDVFRSKGQINILFNLKDSSGWRATSIQIPPSGSAIGSIIGDPEFQITNSGGAVQVKGLLSGSWQGRYYAWLLPKTQAPGTYTATVRWQTGVFGLLEAKADIQL